MGYLLAALLGGFFLFNSQATPDKAARVAESSLRKLFPGAQVRTQFEGKSGRDVLKGRFRAARVEMSGFSFDNGGSGLSVEVVPRADSEGRVGRFEASLRDFRFQQFQVGSLDLALNDVVLDWKALRKQSRLRLVSPPSTSTGTLGAAPRTAGTARLAIPQRALETFVRGKFPDMKDARVLLEPGARITVRGTRPAPIFNTPIAFELRGKLGLSGGRALVLEGPQISAAGVAMAAPLAAAFTRGLNLLFEMDPEGRWPLAVRARELRVESPSGGQPSLIVDADVSLKPAN
jgi:hypothetical protein